MRRLPLEDFWKTFLEDLWKTSIYAENLNYSKILAGTLNSSIPDPLIK